ncbi:glycosyltransferase family 9 protein [Halomonas sp. C05BenzN]|uniref:glycosyltransferase family 9 protein n=1 Tax=Halomonas sp. C05BenzN TaxID=3411041 RepID=UPI003B9391CA
MRKCLNHLRATRDRLRIAASRRLYDSQREPVERVTGLRRVIFVRWDAKWGDSVVFSFVPRAFQEIDPNISVEVIATPGMAPLFQDTFGVDVVHHSERKPSKAKMRALAERIGEVDLVVFFSHLVKHRDIYLLSQLKTQHIASLDDSVGLVDLKLGRLTHGAHMAEKYVDLLKRCGANEVDTRYIVPRNEAAEEDVECWWAARGKRPFVTFNAYSKGRARSLTPESSRRLITSILELLPNHDVCVLSAPGKQAEVEALCEGFAGGRVVHLPETHTIHDNIALIARSQALVSGITATVHLADGLGVPSFVLFPYDPADRDDWHSRHPRSINFLSEPADPLDVNHFDWRRLKAELARFLQPLT